MFSDTLAALYARVPLGMRLGLEAMRAACAEEGNPQDAFRSVHVGGTNGKGSTSAMVESIFRAHGQRTGLYTSPHLARFAERIRIGGEPIDDATLEAHLHRALRHDLSFFETATLAAFLAFRTANVDIAVIEVGIGGRLDATNVLAKPEATAITRIALDHQDRLGETLEEIAREKAGIAKAGVPMILGPNAALAREACIMHGSIVIDATTRDLPHPPGDYQAENARIAWTIAETLGIADPLGLAEARWPGRFERVGDYTLDGAHNPDGMSALLASLTIPPTAVIFGALADKSWREMLALLSTLPGPFFYVAPKGRAAIDPAVLAAAHPGTACASLDEALAAAARIPGPKLLCGSLYLVGEARAKLLDMPVDPIVAL